MNKNKYVIIYDDGCPLCAAYTSGFVKTGLLEQQGRQGFSSVDQSILEKLDLKKAVNEIPLIDTSTDTVYYGIDALLQVLSQKMPWIKTIGNFQPVKWFLLKLYKFISYNRKVIVARPYRPGEFDCSPEMNTRYRLGFLAFFLVFNTMMLIPLHAVVLKNSVFGNSTIWQLQAAHFLLVLTNIGLSLTLKKQAALEYLGQVNMLALIVILLTLPLVLLNQYFAVSAGFNDFLLGMVTFVILKDYARRMKYAGINQHRRIILLNCLCLAGFLLYMVL